MELKETVDGMYYKVTQEYLRLNGEKRGLMRERDNINAKLEIIENILLDLNDILCKHGKHIYEHFEENEDEACKDCYYNDGEAHAECVICDKSESEE